MKHVILKFHLIKRFCHNLVRKIRNSKCYIQIHLGTFRKNMRGPKRFLNI